MSNTIKTAQDFKDLFLHKRHGHLTEYVYFGKDFFEQLLTDNKNYYPYYSEVDLLKNNSQKLTNTLGTEKNFVEIGPGSDRAINNKTLQILKLANKVNSYTAIDFYLPYAQKAAHHVSNAINTKTAALQSDCFYQSNFLLPQDSVLMFLGGTFCNFSDNRVEKFIKDISLKMKKKDIFIMSIDSNTEPNSLKEAYDNIWLKGLAFNAISFFKEKFSIKDFDHSLFEYKYNFDKTLSEVQIFLTSTKEQNFIFDNTAINIKPKQDFHIITSKKRPESFYIEILKKSNLELKQKLEHTKDLFKVLIVEKT